MHQCGMPCRKLVVPSSGSTTQRQAQLSEPDAPALLHQEGVAGPGLGQLLAQRLLGADIGLADEVGRALDADLQLLDLGEVAQQALAPPSARRSAITVMCGERRRAMAAVSPWPAPRSCASSVRTTIRSPASMKGGTHGLDAVGQLGGLVGAGGGLALHHRIGLDHLQHHGRRQADRRPARPRPCRR